MARRNRPPSPYKSWLEYDLHKGPLSKLVYEPESSVLSYTTRGNYTPDFVSEDNPNVIYEVKGRFRTFAEAKKYIFIRESNPDVTLRFIISSEKVRAYPQTKMSLGSWLTKHEFEWCEVANIPKDWR